MKKRLQEYNYEDSYNWLLSFAQKVNAGNKKRMKICVVLLILLPFIIDGIRVLTDSDKIVFLLIWVVSTTLVCVYMIGLEYVNDSVQKKLDELTPRENKNEKHRRHHS